MPADTQYIPAAQMIHSSDVAKDVLLLYVPTGQGIGAEQFSGQKWPGQHGVGLTVLLYEQQ